MTPQVYHPKVPGVSCEVVCYFVFKRALFQPYKGSIGPDVRAYVVSPINDNQPTNGVHWFAFII